MQKIDEPDVFTTNFHVDGENVEYKNLLEVCQGGPRVGDLFISGYAFEGRYGGPALYSEEYLFVPKVVRGFLGIGTHFLLTRIDIKTKKVESFGKKQTLIWFYKMENNCIYFYNDVSKKKKSSYNFLTSELSTL